MKKLLLLLAITGAMLTQAQVITVTSPAGGDIWNTGTRQGISWTEQSVTDVNIDYSTDGGQTWTNVVSNLAASPGNYTWNNVTGPVSVNCFIRVSSSSNSGVASTNATAFIIGPIVTVTAMEVVDNDSSAGGKTDTIVCSGSPVQLLATGVLYSVPSGAGPPPPPPSLIYTWSPTTGLGNPNIYNPVATPTVNTVYTVTADDGDGHTATASVSIDVLALPYPALTATHDTADYLRVDTLTALVAGNQSDIYYYWSENGTGINSLPSTDGGTYITYNYPATFIVTAVNYYYGCSDTAMAVIKGGLNIAIASSTNNTCINDNSGAINITVTGGTGNYTYHWSNNSTAGNISGLANGVYVLTVEDNGGNVGVISDTITSLSNLQVSITNIDAAYITVTDTLEADATGGIGSFHYNWNNGVIDFANVVKTSGIYICTVTDSLGCSLSAQSVVGLVAYNDSFRVAENNSSALDVLKNDLYDQYNYTWFAVVTAASIPVHGNVVVSDGGVTYTPANNYVGSDSFTYVACLADSVNQTLATGFCDTATVYITVIDSIIVSLQPQNTTCPGSCNGSITTQINGGVPPYSFLWNNGDTSQNIVNLCADSTYYITVTDANHATVTAHNSVYNSSPTIGMYAYADSMEAYLNNSNGDTMIFTWSSGAVDTSMYGSDIEVPQSGYYCVTVTYLSGMGGCQLSACDSIGCIGCVWPGDANDDGIADNNDLLPIGLAYGATGPVRPNATNSWTGQTCTDWTDTLLTGTNYKFIDCNGDGTIDANDTLPIKLNFGQIHLKSAEQRVWRSGAPALTVNLSPDTLVNGQTLTATFSLGSSDLPADNVYGIAFTYNYDPKVIQPGSIQASFGTSWLGNSTNEISLSEDLGSNGQLECALTRIDHNTVSGYGPIGMATFVITTDNINGLNLSDYSMQTWISNLTVIDNLGHQLQVNEGGDTGIVQYTPAGIKQINIDAEINIFPNPAHDQLIIQSQNQLAMQEITLIDLLGETVITQTITQPYQTTIDVSSLSSGAYFVQVKTAGGTAMKRFVVAR